ncbi:MAG: DNA replication and repair protein RecF, partial [Synechococcaceae cyanobacterium RM1_1_27]|nr:DNA replication and repair protein RecF [Synechococcaceae cyanobacterium RM1_1_27]
SAAGGEVLQLTYQPQVPLPQGADGPDQVQDLLLQAMIEMRSAERAYGSSLVGPHRDEVDLVINGTPARLYGSQGQQRTLVLALKLAELELIEQVIGDPPLLLLDDVLAELDPYRQDQLLDAIQNRVQTLVTTTHLGSFESRWLESAQVMTVNQGSVRLVKADS